MLHRPSDYNLVFRGPRDTSPETLRKLKKTFVSDLRYSVEQTKKVLEQAPITIQQARSAQELERIQKILSEGGGDSQILSAELEADENDGIQNGALHSVSLSSTASEIAAEIEDASSEDGFSFVLEDDQVGLANPEEYLVEDEEIHDEVNMLLAELKNTVVAEAKIKSSPDENRVAELSDQDLPPIPLELEVSETSSHDANEVPHQGMSLEAAGDDSKPVEFGLEIPEPIPEAKDELFQTEAQKVEPALEPAIVRAERSLPLHQRSLAEVSKGEPLNKSAVESTRTRARVEDATTKINATRNEKNLLNDLRAGFQSDLSLGMLLGLLLLSIGNWYFLFSSGSESTPKMLITMPSMETVENLVEEPVLSEEDLASFALQGSTNFSDLELVADVIIKQRMVKDINFTLTALTIPEKTPEQIVHDIDLAPWLRKIVADNLEITHFSGGRFEAFGKARAFIEDGDLKRRLAIDVSVKGVLSLAERRVHARVIVKRGDVSLGSKKHFLFSKAEDGTFNILLNKSLDLRTTK